MLDVALPLTVIAVLIVVNGFFVAAEFAIAGATRPRVAQLAEEGDVAAQRVLAILNSPVEINRYLSTAQIGITIASLGLGMYGEHAVAGWLVHPLESWGWLGTAAAHTIATVIAVGLLTYLHVVLGEMIPKALALQSAADVAIRLSASMIIAERLFRPLTAVLNLLGNFLLARLGIPLVDAPRRLISTQELSYIVEESSEGGLLDSREQVFLENIIDFHERTVGQVMTPRPRIVAISATSDRMATLEAICQERHSRYPVYDGDRENILGILHAKDLARDLIAPGEEFDLQRLLRPVHFVPESLPLDEMLSQFRAQHFQVAVVLDEYGGTAGLVTLEDLAEEIIGEIQDEFDEELAPFALIEDNLLRVRGDLLLDELTQHYDLEFPQAEEMDTETVGGLIMSMLGHVAQPGESVVCPGARFEVESMEGLAVLTALVYLAPGLGGDLSHDPSAPDPDSTSPST